MVFRNFFIFCTVFGLFMMMFANLATCHLRDDGHARFDAPFRLQ
ncbi:hypothetical protein GGR03_004488 [Aurantimonas endophytica]|uniref:Uncharacterized protein n=1 Tax=Aurantimonas endophytica TaxID=1522175 RepID=A0A7W6MRV6_9HYPH|nr:hypothetical protein [Aurantimonas endophytica]